MHPNKFDITPDGLKKTQELYAADFKSRDTRAFFDGSAPFRETTKNNVDQLGVLDEGNAAEEK